MGSLDFAKQTLELQVASAHLAAKHHSVGLVVKSDHSVLHFPRLSAFYVASRNGTGLTPHLLRVYNISLQMK